MLSSVLDINIPQKWNLVLIMSGIYGMQMTLYVLRFYILKLNVEKTPHNAFIFWSFFSWWWISLINKIRVNWERINYLCFTKVSLNDYERKHSCKMIGPSKNCIQSIFEVLYFIEFLQSQGIYLPMYLQLWKDILSLPEWAQALGAME